MMGKKPTINMVPQTQMMEITTHAEKNVLEKRYPDA